MAVESKCTEWMDAKPALFSDSYDRLLNSLGDSVWFDVKRELRAKPDRYLFLDAAQLVKHAFGLLKRFGSREIRLVYLYWEPANEHDWQECRRHRGEAEELARMVASSNVRLIPMSYRTVGRVGVCGGAATSAAPEKALQSNGLTGFAVQRD